MLWQKILNTAVILIIVCVLLMAYGVQFLKGEHPCSLCLLQRLGMIGVASSLLLNLRFGTRMSHCALALLSALFGQWVALRHIGLRSCPTSPLSDSSPFLGMHLFMWALIIFSCCMFATALILFLQELKGDKRTPPRFLLSDKIALGLLLLVTCGNIVTTALQCGLGVCR